MLGDVILVGILVALLVFCVALYQFWQILGHFCAICAYNAAFLDYHFEDYKGEDDAD